MKRLLSFAIITETWLTKSNETTRRTNDIEYGENIKLIRKDHGGTRRGGGVAIAYSLSRMRLDEIELIGSRREYEVVAALGKDITSGKQLLVISVYLPPSMGKKSVAARATVVADNISSCLLYTSDAADE